jgi:3-carboxy-cis,cis-muconate cycloisomerase
MTEFGALFVQDELLDAVSGRAWLQAMLDFERALARAEAAAGIVPVEAADVIADRCNAELYDFRELLVQGREVGSPPEPLVRALREAVGGDAARYVHWGATSQDVMDTASMLVARRALDLIVVGLDRLAAGLAGLAESHRSTPMAARTLLQQAVPTTFGFKVAGWLVAVLEARALLVAFRDRRLAVQLGGAAGTLAAFGDRGPEVLGLLAGELEMAEPVVPWHTNRTRMAELGGALATTAGVVGKIGLDVALLAQTEVGEVREGTGGGSSTLPHKHNPIASTLARACERLVAGYASVLASSLEHEHERAAGAWHAEWEALSGALAYTGGAVHTIADAIGSLGVDPERMRLNLGSTNGFVVAERVSFLLAEHHGRAEAHEIVRTAARRSEESGRSFEDELRADDRVDLSAAELAQALDPTTYLGSAEAFVDRALAVYKRESGGQP